LTYIRYAVYYIRTLNQVAEVLCYTELGTPQDSIYSIPEKVEKQFLHSITNYATWWRYYL
jgi:hypothetical protein